MIAMVFCRMTTDPTKSTPGPSVVKVFLFTDLVGSTDLKRRLGDVQGAHAISEHDALFRQCLAEFSGEEVDNAGDGFLSFFDRPSDAVRCALAFQQRITSLTINPPLSVRIGMNMGEAVQMGASEGRGKYIGLAVDTAARVMSLGEGGQILMTRSAFDSARSQLLEAPDGSPLTWLAHGSYLCKGIDDPIEVCEVGIQNSSALKSPKDSDKARRNVAFDEEATLGWRPAPGQEIPHRKNWILESKLGDGGFGEVWLASQKHTHVRRVFKFCFQADRLKGLKREVALFRILKESLGDRGDIAQILDWQFEEPPFFLEAEYTEGGSLIDWAEEQGGIGQIKLEHRLQIVIQVAEALAAAHSVGVLHKDIKPGNILISKGRGGAPRARLTDFGIGLVTDPNAIKGRGFTATGVPSTVADRSSSGSGTQMYMAPEMFEGKRATTLCDIFALGVMLYQLTVGDMKHALAMGWERNVKDDLLREDIALCVEGNPALRLQSAKELADLLRNRESRMLAREQQRKEREATRHAMEYAESSRKRRMLVGFTILVLLVFAVGAIHFADAQRRQALQKEKLLLEAEQARAEARKAEELAQQRALEAEYGQYVASIGLASVQSSDRLNGLVQKTLSESPARLRNWEWGFLLREASPELKAGIGGGSEVAPSGSHLDRWSNTNPATTLTLSGHSDKVDTAVFNHDETRILTASWDKTARVWDAVTGARLMTLATHEDVVSGASFTPDGKYILTCSYDKTARIYDADTGRELSVLRGHKSRLNQIICDPASKLAVTSSDDAEVILWDIATGKEVRRFSGHKGAIFKLNFDATGKRLITSSADTSARIWDFPSGKLLHTLEKGHSASLMSVTFSSDGNLAFTGSEDAKIVIWNAINGERLDMMIGHGSTIVDIACSGDGTLMATSSHDGTVRLWDVPTRRQLRVIDPGAGHLGSLTFSRDGSRLLIACLDQTAKVIECADSASSEKLVGHSDLVLDACFSSDGKMLATCSRDTTVKLWDVATGTEIRTIAVHSDYVRNVHFSRDGSKLLTTSWDKTAKLINVGTGDVILSFDGHGDACWYALFNPDETRVLTASWDRTAKVWDTATGRELFTANFDLEKHSMVPVSPKDQTVQTSPILPMNWSPDGQRIVLGSFADRPVILNALNGEIVFPLLGHSAFVVSALYSPKGDCVLTASFDGKIKIWETSTGKERVSIDGRQFVIPLGASFSPDGTKIAFSTVHEGPQIWDPQTGKLIAMLSGHASPVWGCAFSPDSSRIATGADDGGVKIWDTQTGRELLHVSGITSKVHKTLFSPDGRSLVCLSSDGIPRLWRSLPWSDLAPLGDESDSLSELVERLREKQLAATQP